jgi:hypothetical protein
LVFFFVPETAYIRDPIERRLAGINLQVSDNDKPAVKDEKEATNEARLSPQNSAVPEERDSYVKSLRPMTGKIHDCSVLEDFDTARRHLLVSRGPLGISHIWGDLDLDSRFLGCQRPNIRTAAVFLLAFSDRSN